MKSEKKLTGLILEIHMTLGSHELVFIGKSPISIQEYPDIHIDDIESVYLFERDGKENIIEVDILFDNKKKSRMTAKTNLSRLGDLQFGPKIFIRQPYTIDDEIRESIRDMHSSGDDFSDLRRSAESPNPYQ